MDARQLRHFIAVADTLHFGRAAERLGMTQPPLSQSIMALERSLGAPLFMRSKRSVALTSFGEAWLAYARPALDALDALPDIAESLRAGTRGTLALSFVTTADYSLLPSLVRHYAERFPDVALQLTEATSDVQVESLAAGRIDAGILIPSQTPLPSTLDYRPLIREPLIAALPEDWVSDGSLTIIEGALAGDDWMHRPLILFPARVSADFHDMVLSYYRGHVCEPHIAQEAIQMQTIISLVSAGIGIALVPQSMRHLARTGVRYVDLPGDAPLLETGIAWRKNADNAALPSLIDIATGLALG